MKFQQHEVIVSPLFGTLHVTFSVGCRKAERENIENVEMKKCRRKNIEVEKYRKFQLTRHSLFFFIILTF